MTVTAADIRAVWDGSSTSTTAKTFTDAQAFARHANCEPLIRAALLDICKVAWNGDLKPVDKHRKTTRRVWAFAAMCHDLASQSWSFGLEDANRTLQDFGPHALRKAWGLAGMLTQAVADQNWIRAAVIATWWALQLDHDPDNQDLVP